MKSKKSYFLFFIFLSIAVMLVFDLLVIVVFGHPHSNLILRFGIPALAFFAVYCGVMMLNARAFDADYFTDCSGKEMTGRLKKFGAIPIKCLGLNTALHALFLGGIFFRSDFLGIIQGYGIFFFFIGLSMGMTAGTCMYVLMDALVTRTLISNKITEYPRDLL